MPDTVVRPSAKLIKLTYWTAVILGIAVFAYSRTGVGEAVYLLAIPGLMVLWAGALHIQRAFKKLTIGSGKLRYEVGVLSRSTRTMEIRKVQDVRVDQALGQRILGVGNLSIETAGETSRWTIENIDRPQQVADEILAAAHEPDGRPAA